MHPTKPQQNQRYPDNANAGQRYAEAPNYNQRYSEPTNNSTSAAAITSNVTEAAPSPTAISNRLLNRTPFRQEQPKAPFTRQEPDTGIKDLREMRQPSAISRGIDGIPTIGSAPSVQQAAPQPDDANKPKFVTALGELHNTLRGRLYGSDGSMLAEIPVRDLLQSIQETNNVAAIVFDGVITQRLLELASARGIKSVYANRQGQVFKMPANIAVYTTEK